MVPACVWENTERAFGRADALGLDVSYVRWLPIGWLGAYNHDESEILLRHGLPAEPVLHGTVLWHELGHAEFGHTGGTEIQEAMADRYAAKQLIRLDDWVAARAACGTDDVAIAEQLGVMPWVVRVFRGTINGGLFTRVGIGSLPPDPKAYPINVGECLKVSGLACRLTSC